MPLIGPEHPRYLELFGAGQSYPACLVTPRPPAPEPEQSEKQQDSERKKPRHPDPFKFPTRFKADLPYLLHVVPSKLSPCLNPESAIDLGNNEPGMTLQRECREGGYLVWRDVLKYGQLVKSPVDIDALPFGIYRLVG